jgi:hypothetical protein
MTIELPSQQPQQQQQHQDHVREKGNYLTPPMMT